MYVLVPGVVVYDSQAGVAGSPFTSFCVCVSLCVLVVLIAVMCSVDPSFVCVCVCVCLFSLVYVEYIQPILLISWRITGYGGE